MPYQYKRVPDVVKFGSLEHHNAVKNLYRRTMKWAKQIYRYNYAHWDWFGYHCRQEFEKCRTMTDPGEALRIMKELEDALDLWRDPDPNLYPWDGPQSVAFMRYMTQVPKKAFEHRVGRTIYPESWITQTTDEYYTKQEIEKWRARYITIFRHETMKIANYSEWLGLKKRLEEELKYKIEELMRMMNKSSFDYTMDWPYNAINKFSDGYQPDWKLDIAFQDHWDEDTWKRVAELDSKEVDALQQYEWADSQSKRSIDRMLPGK